MTESTSLPMSVLTARKILGKTSQSLTDQEIEQQITLASLLKNIFFASQLYQKIETQKGGNK